MGDITGFPKEKRVVRSKRRGRFGRSVGLPNNDLWEKVMSVGLIDSVLSKSAEGGISYLRDWAKGRKIKQLIRDTAIRAVLIDTTADLASKFKDEHLTDELLSHHRQMDVSKAEAVARFLGGESDNAAISFVSEFYDAVTSIVITDEGALSGRKAFEVTQEARADIESLKEDARLTAIDEKAQVSLLEEVVLRIQLGDLEVDRLPELAKECEGSLASFYIQAYYSLCIGAPVSFATVRPISGHDGLAFALAGVAASAERLEDVVAALELCSFDSSNLQKAVRLLLEDPVKVDEPVVVEDPEVEGFAEFVGLVDFECAFGKRTFLSMAEFAHAGISWNPIAIKKLELSQVIAAAAMDRGDVAFLTGRLIEGCRPWFPPMLIGHLEFAASVAFSHLDKDEVSRILESAPDCLADFVLDEVRSLELRDCGSVAKAESVLTWAEARRNCSLLIAAAMVLLELDETRRFDVVETFSRCRSWAFPTMAALNAYVNVVEPNISYARYRELGSGKENEVAFHLVAYKLFHSKEPDSAKYHIERGIQMMKGEFGALDLPNADIWVPYLITGGRESEVEEIASGYFSQAPYYHFAHFLSAVMSCDGSEELLDRLVSSAARIGCKDRKAAECVAGHLVRNGQDGLAGRFALASFKETPSEILAEIAAQWMIDSSLDVDEDIVSYAEKRDSGPMNLLLAQCAHANHRIQERNARLIRASFGESEIASRALLMYALWNAEDGEGRPAPDAAGYDTYVVIATKDGEEHTLIFLADPLSVKEGGAEGVAGLSFSARSDEFVACRGLRVGNSVSLWGNEFVVREIGSANSLFSRIGFAEIPNTPGGMVLSGAPEEILEQLQAFARESARKKDIYKDGFMGEHGILYFGIETGAFLRSVPQLEFTIGAICNPDLPYRKCRIARNGAIDEGCKFLLSYSALVVLSLLDVPDEICAAIHERCCATKSTVKRLENDAAKLADEPYVSIGKLGYDDGKLALYEFGEDMKQYCGSRCRSILRLTQELKTAEPSLGDYADVRLPEIMGENAVIDIRTAADNGYVLVTEDILEAQMVDGFDLSTRCSISFMLLCLGHASYILRRYLVQMQEWYAVPVLEEDVAELLQAIISEVVAQIENDIEI